MAGWTIEYSFVGSDKEIEFYARNVSGSAYNSASFVEDRNEGALTPLAGVYRFTMESSTTVSVKAVHGHDSGNPQIYTGTVTVTCDGSTSNYNLLPGVAVILNAAADAGDIFEIGIGVYWDSNNSQWIRVLPRGPALPGWEGSQITLKAKNGSGYTQTSTKVVATNCARVENDNGGSRPFYAFRQVGTLNPTADSDLNGQAITFDNFAASRADILVDGVAWDVYDLTNEALVPDGEQLHCDGQHVYKFADGTPLQSIEFMLSDDLQETDTATIYVSDGGESIEVRNVGDSWVAGATGIDLTESGQATGTVTDGEYVNFELRVNPSASEDTDLNPRAFSLRVSSVKV